jgi:hypothetical protein
MEDCMIEATNEKEIDLNELAQTTGLRFPVKVSAELSELLRPNAFLHGLGIRYSERIKTVLDILRGSMVPGSGGGKETIPKGEILFPLTITKGPYIREEPVSIKAEMTNNGGTAEILLTAIPTEE